MKAERNDVLSILLWGNFIVFCIHLLDETLMNSGFVIFIQHHFWSGFKISDFFIANAVWLLLIGLSNTLYDIFGKWIAILPLAFLWERCFNGIFHLGSTIYFQEYSPGCVSSCIFFVLLYFTFRFVVHKGYLNWVPLFVSGLAALIFEGIFISSMWWAH
jgi:hypothetical protein